jgi:biotin carboxylase
MVSPVVTSRATATMGRVAAEPDRARALLVLGAGPAQLGLLEAARAAGIWTAVCDRDPSAPGFAYADRRCIVSTDDEPAVERLASALPLDGVIAPGTDTPIAVAARVAAKIGVPHPIPVETAMVVTSNARRRDALAEAAVPQPRWQIASSPGEIELPFPLVVKQADRGARAGLAFVRRPAGLEAAFVEARRVSRGGAVLVEEYVEGPEVTVTGFSAGGDFVVLAVCDRLPADEELGPPQGQVWPSPHAETAAEVTRRAVSALGIAEGPSLTRLRISRGGPEVIEVAARLGGGHDTELVELVTGVDLSGLALAAAIGQPIAASEITVRQPTVGGAAVRFLIAPPGELESVEVPQGLNGVVSTRLYREPGFVFAGAERAGTVLTVGATPEEALARAGAAVERVRLVTAGAEAMV